MSTGEGMTGVVGRLRAALGQAPDDCELLARYARNDQAAFEALVRRHGGLVLGVARRQLGDVQQAEDVFQATFLALARSATRLGHAGSLANWLYTVALRLARKTRARAARQAARERAVLIGPQAAADPLAEISGRELLAAVDEELGRLPEAYRLPLLLCCVQGLSREEAARQLGWSDGAVKGRLERGRRRLAGRLARRGLAPAALLLAPVTKASPPVELLARTAALAASSRSDALPAAVRALAAAAAPGRTLPVAVMGALLAAGLLGLAVDGMPPGPGMPKNSPPASAGAGAKADPADDPLPAGAALRFGTSRFRHGTAIQSLAVSADDRLAVAGSGNHVHGSVRLFDLGTGRAVGTVKAGWPFDEAVALSPDGAILAVKATDAVYLFDPVSGKQLRKLNLPEANSRSVTQWLTFAPDGKSIAVSSEGKEIHLLDAESGTVMRSFVHEHVVFAATFSRDGTLLAAGGYDSEGGTYFGRLWDVATGKERRRFTSGQGGIRSLAFSPDGRTLAGGGDDARLRLWEVATGKEVRAFSADGYRIRSVAFAPDGGTVAAAGDSIRLYDPATGVERLRIEHRASGLHFNADGKILTAAVAGAIHRWDAATGKALTPQDSGDSCVDQVAVSPDGRRVATLDQSGWLHLWDGGTGKHLRRLQASYGHGFVMSADGRLLAWPVEDLSVKFKDRTNANWTRTGSRLRLYDVAGERFLDRFAAFEGEAHDLAFTADGRTLLTTDRNDGSVRLWDVPTGAAARTFRPFRDGEQTSPYSLWRTVLSPDGRTLAVVGTRDRTSALFGGVPVRLWDVSTGKELHDLPGHINNVNDAAFSPDGRLLATAGQSFGSVQGAADKVLVWDVASGRPVRELPDGLPTGSAVVAFSTDGRTLATASADGTVVLWEVATWARRAEFKGHRDRVTALTFGPKGRLFSGSLDTTTLVWDTFPPRPDGPGSLAAAWAELMASDAGAAFRAMGRLRAAPAEAVTLIAERLPPAEVAEPARVRGWVADLDSPRFATREQATGRLRRAGPAARAALREAVEKSESAEVKRRAGELLAELEKSALSPDDRRALRAVETLEAIASPEAARLLARLAKGDPSSPLTRAAEQATKRLLAP